MILLQDVPDGYEYCFAGNGKCPKASSCLRAIAAQLLSESEAPQPQSVRAVNPFYVGSLSGSSTCARYRSSEQLHYARGMTHLFDEVPTKLLFTVRHRVMGCFSCERYYYHCRKGERPISPEEQQRIARVFKAVGISTKPRPLRVCGSLVTGCKVTAHLLQRHCKPVAVALQSSCSITANGMQWHCKKHALTLQ